MRGTKRGAARGKELLTMETKCDNQRECPCTYDCPRHGQMLRLRTPIHREHNEGVPGCFFSKEAEATYDRSIEALARGSWAAPVRNERRQ